MPRYEINVNQTVNQNHTIVFDSDKSFDEIDLICDVVSKNIHCFDDIKFSLRTNKCKIVAEGEGEENTVNIEIDALIEVEPA